MPKRKIGSVDQDGSVERQGGAPRETLKSGFSIRLTFLKVETIDGQKKLDQWINGSDECPELVDVLKQKFEGGRVSLEVGKEGQYHFQCATICKQKRQRQGAVRAYLLEHFAELKFPKLDYCDPSRNDWAAIEYCGKTDSHVAGPWEWGIEPKVSRDLTIEDLDKECPMTGRGAWQQEIYDRYIPEPPIMTSVVHWYVDPEGQHGKSTLLKRMALALDFYLLDGGPQKMKFQMAKNPKKGYCLNVTRLFARKLALFNPVYSDNVLCVVRNKEEHFSYEGLENLSDGFFCDTFGSDQAGMCIRKGSWVVVMANWPPIAGKLSENRIKVYNWCDQEEKFI